MSFFVVLSFFGRVLSPSWRIDVNGMAGNKHLEKNIVNFVGALHDWVGCTIN